MAVLLGGYALYLYSWKPKAGWYVDPVEEDEGAGIKLFSAELGFFGLLVSAGSWPLWLRVRKSSKILARLAWPLSLATLASAIPLGAVAARLIVGLHRMK